MSDIWSDFYKRLDKFTKGNTSSESLNYATHVSLKHKYIYVETPKVACSTIKISLQRLELEMQNLNREEFEDVHIRDFSPLLHLTQLPNFEDYLRSEDYFKFCFVRNPYQRLLSCYLDKIINPISFKEKENILFSMGLETDQNNHNITFNDFVSVIEKQTLLEMDYHWRPQTFLTCQSSINYDFVGKLETFDDDFKEVADNISLDLLEYYLPEVRHQTNSKKLLQNYYDDDLFERVYNIYKVDFLNFSYDKNYLI